MKEENNIENKRRRSTFAVLFYLNRSKMKKSGLCPVMGRISLDAGTAVFSTKTDASPERWDAKAGRLTGSGKDTKELNRKLDSLLRQIEAYYNEIVDTQGYVTAEMVKNALNGIGRKPETLLKLFEEHNIEYEKRVGVDRAKMSHYLYLRSCRLLAEFIKHKYDIGDYPLRQITRSFADAYEFYLKIDKRMSAHTVSGHMIMLKKITRRAVNSGILRRDPLMTYFAEQPDKKCRHLQPDEIERIMHVQISSKQVCHTRDMFIFSTFTGIAYADMCRLTEKNLIKEGDGSLWIRLNRQKTGTESNIKLLPVPLQIIEKYHSQRKGDKLFNMISPSCLCTNLGKIAKLCDIEHINFHMARHNFGTHITLSQGVPIETVCQMMGHTSIKTTQIYAKITAKKVEEDMKLLSGRIAGRYTVFEDEQMPVGLRSNNNFRLNDNTVNPKKSKQNDGQKKNNNR